MYSDTSSSVKKFKGGKLVKENLEIIEEKEIADREKIIELLEVIMEVWLEMRKRSC